MHILFWPFVVGFLLMSLFYSFIEGDSFHKFSLRVILSTLAGVIMYCVIKTIGG